MNIVIYGATSYIGRHLANHLISKGYTLFNVSRTKSDLASIINFNYSEPIEEIIKKCDPAIIIYLSASFNNNDIDEIINVNLNKPIKILNSICGKDIEFIYIGSYWQFGDSDRRDIPIDLYSASKKAISPFLQYFRCYFNISCKEIVLYGTYGTNDNRGKLLDLLLDNAIKGNKIKITEGNQQLNLCHVNRIAEKFEEILLSKESKFQILSNINYTPRDIIAIINKYKKCNVIYGGVEYKRFEIMKIWDNLEYRRVIIDDELESYIRTRLS